MTSEVPWWRRGIPVIALTLLLAVPVLVGSVGFVASDVGSARDATERLDDVDINIEESLELIELRTALLDEHNWTLVDTGLRDVGVSPETVLQVLGLDTSTELQRAAQATDVAIATVGDSRLLRGLNGYRASAQIGMAETLDAFDSVEGQLSLDLDGRLEALKTTAATAGNAEGVLQSVQRLRAASEAQRSVASVLTSAFGARSSGYSVGETGPANRVQLVADVVTYEQASDDFLRSNPGPQATAAWRTITASAEYDMFFASVYETVDETIGVPGTAADPASDFNDSARLIQASEVVVDDHRALLDIVALEVRAEAQKLSDTADREVRNTVWALAGLVAATIAAAITVAYVLVRPARRLSAGAARIGQGDTTHKIPVRGPKELRDATRALNSAAATLDLVEQQAHQMASGSLDAEDVAQGAPGPLGESLRSAIETLATSIAEREQLRDELAHEASHDGLTGLPNRTAVLSRLDDAVARARRNGHHVAVMFLDLDGFKAVNDQHGHAVGDAVLKAVARRFQGVLRQGDVVGRLGGDEFLIIAEPIRDLNEAHAIASRLVDAASEPVETDTVTTSVGVSVGISICGSDCESPTDLLNAADVAVYEAKADPDRAIVMSSGIDQELQVPG